MGNNTERSLVLIAVVVVLGMIDLSMLLAFFHVNRGVTCITNLDGQKKN